MEEQPTVADLVARSDVVVAIRLTRNREKDARGDAVTEGTIHLHRPSGGEPAPVEVGRDSAKRIVEAVVNGGDPIPDPEDAVGWQVRIRYLITAIDPAGLGGPRRSHRSHCWKFAVRKPYSG